MRNLRIVTVKAYKSKPIKEPRILGRIDNLRVISRANYDNWVIKSNKS